MWKEMEGNDVHYDIILVSISCNIIFFVTEIIGSNAK